jgi:hypothetical protein
MNSAQETFCEPYGGVFAVFIDCYINESSQKIEIGSGSFWGWFQFSLDGGARYDTMTTPPLSVEVTRNGCCLSL